MKEIKINVDSYNSDSINTIQGNNNAEVYKIYVLFNKRRIDLTGKTVKMAYLRTGTVEGDVINLNITNATEGEITLQITNKISKKDGVYSCQLAIYGADGFLEHTATFGLTVEANIFTKIAGEIENSKDFTYLENILDKASKLSEKLKENTSSATNANSNLESNIIEANNINSKLLENTSTATSLNKNLESNINLAKEVKETIKDLDTKNTTATVNISKLTDLNAKAEELSSNIQQALPINTELKENIKIGQPLVQEAVSKNTELQASLEKTKEFINGLDGSQNIPQIRMDVTELQNGLKSNQSLAYSGSSISAENTLEGRTEGMKIKGRTLVNLVDERVNFIPNLGSNTLKVDNNVTTYSSVRIEPNTEYYIIKNKKTDRIICAMVDTLEAENAIENLPVTVISQDKVYKIRTTSKKILVCYIKTTLDESCKICIAKASSNYTEYFEGIKSFGEAEQEGDKYKISILSHGYNLLDFKKINKNVPWDSNGSQNNIVLDDGLRIFRCTSNHYPQQTLVYLKKGTYFITKTITPSRKDLNNKVLMYFYKKNDKFSMLSGDTNIIISESGYYHVGLEAEGSINDNDYFDVRNIGLFSKNIPYEPYKEDKKDILIKEPLRSVGDIQDIMYEDNGQVKIDRYIKQYTFNGDEENISINMSYNTESMAVFSIVSDVFNDKKEVLSQYDATSLFCNNFLCGSWFDIYSSKVSKEMIASSTDNNSVIYFKILKSKLTTPDVNGFKAWLKANPTTIVYQLATPTVEIVENCVDIDLDTFGEKTYFNILNSIKGSLDFKVPSNIASIVQNTAREVNNIWDVINNLLVPSLIDINKNVAMSTIKNNLK
ncbi:BppU family phage baseplate upper protein [Clostridium perfringens]|uniref:BppU family phage baseplate upper protein n=1 Tax=Clostridium perfringens TaxID=1502 RepID=UPI002A2E8476|nr:BppU family phage baseplate upper protein [Clostridium perfringens]MDK0754323.1 BppU family phage baseplate upper protein [Clostridium perfringens]MDK0757497.1 BppU family phage baseplate upper protein [Clostridium perfringens]